MAKYLISIHRPANYDPFIAEDPTMDREIDVLNDDMVAAGVRVFVGGLRSPNSARSLRPQADRTVLVTEGLYLHSNECVDGFWVLEVADLEEAMMWGRKAAIACRAPVEVRPFH